MCSVPKGEYTLSINSFLFIFHIIFDYYWDYLEFLKIHLNSLIDPNLESKFQIIFLFIFLRDLLTKTGKFGEINVL